MNITSKKELDLLVSSLIENQNIKDKEEVFLSLRENILQILINQGEILPLNYLKLFFVFKDINIESHSEYSKHINFFKKYYNNASLEEKFIINNFIFGLEILNGDFESIKDYIKRGIVLNFHKIIASKEGTAFIDFIKDEKIDKEIIIETFRELIEPTNFLSANKEEKRSIFVNALTILWNSSNMYACKIWLTIFDDLVKLLNVMIENELIEEQMYIHFFIYHIYGNNIQTIDEWKQFNKVVEKPVSIFYKEWGEKHKLFKVKNSISSDKKKIGFLIDRIIGNSPFIIFYSLVKSLLKSREFNKNYEIYVYSMNYVDKQLDDKNAVNALIKLGVKFFSPYDLFINQGYYYSHLQKAIVLREKIIEDKIDCLIGGGGYDIPIFLFATRTAPKQIFWSHGNCVSDLEGIDNRISHFPQECKEWEWKIFNVPIAEEFLVGTKDEKEKGLKIKEKYLEQFGKDTVILGTIGRLIKIDSEEYLKTIAQIMEQNPNTIYLACGDGNEENIKKKIEKYEIDEERFIFTGYVNPHVYGWVIDICLDTFPLYGGNSVEEVKAKGKAIVRLHNGDKNKIYNGVWDREKSYKGVGGIEALINMNVNQKNIDKLYNINKNESLINYFQNNKFLYVRSPVVTIDRYIELANLFIKNKKLREEGLKNGYEDNMIDSPFNQDIKKFMEILNG